MRGKRLKAFGMLVLGGLAQDVQAWSPGVSAPAATYGFTVDTENRADVVSFWHSVYPASENYRDAVGWTGTYSSIAAGAEGTVSQTFIDMMERRLNFYRAMCGVSANVRFNKPESKVVLSLSDKYSVDSSVTKAQAAQRSAFMISMAQSADKTQSAAMTHDPPRDSLLSSGWTEAAWNANANGNLSFGLYGSAAIDAYLKENYAGSSNWNTDVGHRRWVLYSRATQMATGDSPGVYDESGVVRRSANVLYVTQAGSEKATVDTSFVSYPPSGYVPAFFNSKYWSLSCPGASFASATVQMTDGEGNSIPVTVVSRKTGFGDPAIVWQVPDSYAATSVEGDTTLHVSVSGITGAATSTYQWDVTLIDPNDLGFSPEVSGNQIVSPDGDTFSVTPMDEAERLETNFGLVDTSSWTEGAEDGTVHVIDGTDDYSLVQGSLVNSGKKSFHLTHAVSYDPEVAGIPDQFFEINREIIPGNAGVLSFYYRRGFMTPNSRLAIELSEDEGATWIALGDDIVGKSVESNKYAIDNQFTLVNRVLPATDQPINVRFRYYYRNVGVEDGAAYSYSRAPSYTTGIYIDDITVTGGKTLISKNTVTTTTETEIPFNSDTAGATLAHRQNWYARSRVILGGHAFAYGTALQVKVIDPQVVEAPIPDTAQGNTFKLLDIDGDTYLSPTEWLGIYATPPSKETIFTKVDTDQDGMVSFTEMTQPAALAQTVVSQYFSRGTAFLELDLDHNDVISMDELKMMFLPPVSAAILAKYGDLTYEQWQDAKALPAFAVWEKAKALRAARTAAFTELDVDQSGVLTTDELSKMFAPPVTLSAVQKLGTFTLEQWVEAKTLPSFTTWEKAKAIRATRLAAFQELDVDQSGDLSIEELSKMFAPPVSIAAVQKYGTYTEAQWVEAKTLPSFPTWAKAKAARQARETFLLQLDADDNGNVTYAEFAHLFKQGTVDSKILPSWLAATATAKGVTPPSSITNAQFVEAKLPTKLVYYAW
jgi:Ca2+-binding EF-hand superfamily protein